jgi:phosphoribosylformylglycinamidine cyclo-ligase
MPDSLMTGNTYREAGVDLDAAAPIKQALIRIVSQTHGPTVFSNPGFFAGGIDNPSDSEMLLVASTDSVGTKVRIGVAAGDCRSLGEDIVNHCVNDILTTGAQPLFFLDYIGIASADGVRITQIAEGLRDACAKANCSIIGGETAFLPGMYQSGDFDLVGFIVGTVSKSDVLDPRNTVQEGDALIGIPSSGMHTNGASLIRKVFALDDDPRMLDERLEGLDGTLGEALLVPHRSYLDVLRPVMAEIRGMAHITGGGLGENMTRVLPRNLSAQIHTNSWEVPALFRCIQSAGSIDEAEMFRVFNMGVGMIVICAPERVNALLGIIDGAWRIGEVVTAQPSVAERVALIQ